MIICADTSIERLTSQLIKDILNKENFEGISASKGSFLTGGSIIVCESRGLQEYIQKTCAEQYGIWTALSFKPLAGLLMQCAYNLSKDKKDENDNVFNQRNLIWAIYRLLEGEKKTFFFTNELASLFFAYQIYRPNLINNWNNGKQYTIQDADSNFLNNEKFQRELWTKLKKEYTKEQDITQLYELFPKSDKKVLPKQIFIFCPISIAPVQLKALEYLSNAGCKVNVYINQICNEYFGEKENNLGNQLLSGLGKSAKVLYNQVGWENLEHEDTGYTKNETPKTLLELIQESVFSDFNLDSELIEKVKKDNSLVINSCFSELREVEVLCDYLLGLFESNNDLTPQDIAVVSPNIEKYANAIESVFGRHQIPIIIADRDVKKHNKTAQLLNLLFSLVGSRYEAPDIIALYEYSLYVQEKEQDPNDIEYLKKCIKENAIRYGFDNPGNPPNYSFKTGFNQLSAGFFMIAENGFSEDYCYPDVEGSRVTVLGDFANFVNSLQIFEEESRKEKTIEDWDDFFRENLKSFFGTDEMDFNEEDENPYQTVIGAWDSLKKEMLIGFGSNSNIKIGFSVLKIALQNNLEGQAHYSYTLSGRLSFSNIDTIRAVPHKVICCIGMNSKEFPRQNRYKEISLMPDKQLGDKNIANEDRLIFLQMLCIAKEKFYISWIGQNELTMDELEPSSVVVMLLENIKELITKYPLQPFSKKYFNGELETYDNRWNIDKNNLNETINIWNWKIDNTDTQKEKSRNINDLFNILKDTPKYFIKNICNISLPENTDLLDNLEPFTIENALDKWILSDMIIQDDKLNIKNEIEIMKCRGELPDGIYADYNINAIINEAQELKDLAKDEEDGTYWISPSKDKGKYRLKHWLYHLDLNVKTENQNTKMFLKDKEPVILELKGMSKEAASKILETLWQIADELENRLLPVFPDAAWTYINKGEIPAIEEITKYSDYANMAFRNIDTIEGELKKQFMEYSKILFNDYLKYRGEA